MFVQAHTLKCLSAASSSFIGKEGVHAKPCAIWTCRVQSSATERQKAKILLARLMAHGLKSIHIPHLAGHYSREWSECSRANVGPNVMQSGFGVIFFILVG